MECLEVCAPAVSELGVRIVIFIVIFSVNMSLAERFRPLSLKFDVVLQKHIFNNFVLLFAFLLHYFLHFEHALFTFCVAAPAASEKAANSWKDLFERCVGKRVELRDDHFGLLYLVGVKRRYVVLIQA